MHLQARKHVPFFLTSRRPFDRLWHNGLLYKLAFKGDLQQKNELGLFCTFLHGESGFKILILISQTDFEIIGLKIANFAVWRSFC